MRHPLPRPFGLINIKPCIGNGICEITPTGELLISRKTTVLILILRDSEWDNPVSTLPLKVKSVKHKCHWLEDGEEGDYLTDALTDRAISFIKDNKNKPFFINFWFYTVTLPSMPRRANLPSIRKKQRHLDIPTGIRMVCRVELYAHKQQDSPGYASMVESMDENIGEFCT